MKATSILALRFLPAATLAIWLLASAGAPAQTQPVKPRLGVYDSRAVAVAYANSTEFREELKATRAEHERAKADNDTRKMKEIEARMKLGQRRAHEQAFSTGSVAGIMAKVSDKLPGVAEHAGVRAIVSKWELNFSSSEVETVDVTDELIALFHVSDKGKTWAKGIQSAKPIPMEQITDDMD